MTVIDVSHTKDSRDFCANLAHTFRTIASQQGTHPSQVPSFEAWARGLEGIAARLTAELIGHRNVTSHAIPCQWSPVEQTFAGAP